MTVETVQYISDLEPVRPQGGDSIAQGDDHIRNIKKGLKNTFPKIDGEVNASQDEINTLVGIDTSQSLQNQLDEGSKVLQDQIDVIDKDINDPDTGLKKQVSDNTASINDLSGRVSTLEQDLPSVAEMVRNQKIEDHADVDITTLEAGMALVWDGTNWVAQKVSGGGAGMITWVSQPQNAGDFEVSGYYQIYSVSCPVGISTQRITVPDGMVFCFEYFYGETEGNQTAPGTLAVPLDSITVDGKKLYQSSQPGLSFTGEDHGITWPEKERAGIIRVEESLVFASVNHTGTSSQDWRNTARIRVAGYFAEA
jgi:hypothetical protein